MRLWRKRVVVWMNLQGLFKIILSASLVLMMLFIYTYELPAAKTWTYWAMPLSGKVIALDAGHGGPDGGAVSKEGLIEKDVSLAISLYLRDYLQQAGAVVVMTREADQDLAEKGTRGLSRRKTEDLKKRVEFIKNEKANLLISIHLNSIPSERWSGAQTFYSAENPHNVRLASLIQNEMTIKLNNTDRVAKTVNNVYLLKAVTVPSALVEVGFLSNPAESNRMAEASYQQKVAASIYQGILRYYSGEKIGTPQL